MEILIFVILWVVVIAIIKSQKKNKKNVRKAQLKPSGSFAALAQREASLKSKSTKTTSEDYSKSGYNKHGERTGISTEEFETTISSGLKINENRFTITDSAVHCPDGETISLSKIVSVKAPKWIIGTDPSLAETVSLHGGAVVILYDKVGHWPKEKVIGTESMQKAQEIVKQIQFARKALKSPKKDDKSGTPRIEVGKCSKCGKPLRVRACAIKYEMNLTCKCGHYNTVTVSDDLINKSSPHDFDHSQEWSETIDYSRCMICSCELNFQRYISGIIMGNFENAFNQHAYKCRQCGAPICLACAKKSRCIKCGKNVFDLDTERVK